MDEEENQGISNPCGAICLGVILFVGGLSVGGWNEYRSVATAKAISLGRDNVVNVQCSPVDPALNLELVHLACPLTGEELLGAGLPGLGGGQKGLSLTSDLEVYQWVQVSVTKGTKDDKKTVKEWHKQWKPSYAEGHGPQTLSALPSGVQSEEDELVNPPLSSQGWWNTNLRFGHSTIAQATNIKVGDFSFPDDLLSSVLSYRSVSLNCSACPAGVQAMGDTLHYKYKYAAPGMQDRIGDMRQTLQIGTADFASVLARQAANAELVPWPSPYDEDYTIYLASGKQETADDMFTAAEEANEAVTWILRLVTCFCTCAGIFFLLQPLSIFASWIPCVGELLSDLVDMVLSCVACAIGSMCWCMVAGFVWVAYRPLIGVPLLLVAIGLATWLVFFRGQGMKKQNKVSLDRGFDGASNLEEQPDGKEMEERPMKF